MKSNRYILSLKSLCVSLRIGILCPPAVRSRVGCLMILPLFPIRQLLTMLSSALVSIIAGMKHPFSITLIVKTLWHVRPQVERVTGLSFCHPSRFGCCGLLLQTMAKCPIFPQL